MNSDKITKIVLVSVSFLILLIAGGMVFSLVSGAIPSFKEFGLSFLYSDTWNPTEGREKYSALPFIAGTLMTSVIALLLALPLSFATSLFLGEYYRNTKVANVLSTMVDLLAGIPSIVYGFFALMFISPILRDSFDATYFNAASAIIVIASSWQFSPVHC